MPEIPSGFEGFINESDLVPRQLEQAKRDQESPADPVKLQELDLSQAAQ